MRRSTADYSAIAIVAVRSRSATHFGACGSARSAWASTAGKKVRWCDTPSALRFDFSHAVASVRRAVAHHRAHGERLDPGER